MSADGPSAGYVDTEQDPPFGGYSVAELRESANYLARLQDEQRRPRFFHRHCPEHVSWLTMTWVEHALDALDLLELVVDEWTVRGDGGCTKAIQDRVMEALRGTE